jgi:membrane-bound metal-dependent hydrolase YbcI (DUF457 family)
MSWAAHELESYLIQKHVRARVSYLAILLGCFLPDLLTKLPVYGFSIGGFTLKADDPAQYHRGWPGVGFTHSLLFGALVALLVLTLTKSQGWALGLLLGQWAHALTDAFDSVGVMLFFPFSTQNYSTGMWAYAAQQGKYGDAAAYYSSLGGVWDLFWLLMALTAYRVFRRDFFFETVVPNDSAWKWLQRKLAVSDSTLLAMYRAYFIYGSCRIVAWFIWARFIEKAPMDLSWGGPYWVESVSTTYPNIGTLLLNSTIGILGLGICLALLWGLIGRRLWARAESEKEQTPAERSRPQ